MVTRSRSRARRQGIRVAGALGLALLLALGSGSAWAQDSDEQGPPPPETPAADGAEDDGDALNKALDSTATQWSFQGAWQVMPDYYNDTMSTGETLDQLILGSGVDTEHLRIISPTPRNHDDNVEIMREELAYDGPSVIIARRSCLESIKRA